MSDVRFIGPVMGRYVLESRQQRGWGVKVFACRMQSISAVQVVASAPLQGAVGEGITTHFEPFGVLRGKVVRHIPDGFVMEIEAEGEDRDRLVTKIEWYKKRTFAGIEDKRQHRRVMPRDPRSAVVLSGGEVLPCLVIDMSASGIAVSADYEPSLGEPLAVGRMVGRVVRRLEVGFAVQFIGSQDLEIVEELMRAPEEWDRATRAVAAGRERRAG
jgi:PilZ domain-containing protein